jgi:NADH dehydrogenase
MKRVVVVGAGFGGLSAVNGLAGKGLDVLLVDRQNFHLFQPLLYQVATAALDQGAIAYPVRGLLKRNPGLRFRMTEVTGVDLDHRQLLTAGGPIDYDYLVLAAGTVTNFFGIETVRRHAYDLKHLADAVALRSHILRAFENAVQESDPAARAAWMTFVIVGGGPTGVEFAGALAELVHRVLIRDFPDLPLDRTRILLVEASPHLLAPFPPALQQYARTRLERLGVEVKLGAAVTDAEPDHVVLKDGTIVPARTLLWAAGVHAAPLAGAVPGPKARGGRVPVQPDLGLAGHPDVFVVGDMGYLEWKGAPLPQVSPVAIQQGAHAARVILARERGEAATPFSYWDKGMMATIGRGAAVGRVFGVSFTGFLAWLAWLGLHLFYLVGFRNRLLALVDWAADYLRFGWGVRLITREERESAGLAAPSATAPLAPAPVAGSTTSPAPPTAPAARTP